MPLDPAFLEDCLYLESGILLDEVLHVDVEQSLVRARMPTHDALPITASQRVVPGVHPRHVSGGLMVHMTGVIAFVHFYYVLGLRHADGWTGYGARIHDARFRALAEPGLPLTLQCRAIKNRRIGDKISVRYEMRFEQGEQLVYEGEQTALWIKAR